MNRPIEEIRDHANQILALIDQGFPFSLGPEERKTLLTEAGKVLRKLDSIERDVLSIGLLGGTGVGKSTIMNGLAGMPIASASHRRPHTDRVLLYRHERRDPLPSLKESGIPFREFTHGIDSIERILLCDLPDFDSLAAEHRERVIAFLDHLDLLVWVASPEKYGDARFYEFLGAVPKAKQNFAFVLNKVDLLFEPDGHRVGYEKLDRVVSQFRDHLRQVGMDEPLLYAVSAEQATGQGRAQSWNQFPLFRQYVFQQREVKEIRAIRSANLDLELEGIFSVLQREAVHLRALVLFLDEALQDLEARKSSRFDDAGKVISSWLEDEWRTMLLQGRGSALVGPGQAIDLLIREIRGLRGDARTASAEPFGSAPPEGLLSTFKAQLEETGDRIRRHILLHGLPAPILERMESILNVSGRAASFEKALAGTVPVRLQTPSVPSFPAFRGLQHLTYGILFVLFLVAIGGGEAWEGMIASPGWRSGLRLLASWIHALFSTQGLAALTTYLLLNLFLGFRFYRRHRRKMEKLAREAAKHGTEALLEVWGRHLQSLAEDLEEFRSDIRGKIDVLDGRWE
jgi:GTP-binding protein EngB required for normal cell division